MKYHKVFTNNEQRISVKKIPKEVILKSIVKMTLTQVCSENEFWGSKPFKENSDVASIDEHPNNDFELIET
jgi:hypothetical protein